MISFTVKTKKRKEIIDITELVISQIPKDKQFTGICFLFVLHTTASVTTADLDPGTDLDTLEALDKIIPKLASYRHPHNPSHVPDHINSSIIGPSLFVPVKNSDLILGSWQRIILIELDGPRERIIATSFIAE